MIVPWDADEHMPMLGRWLRARGQAENAGTADLYPLVGGFVVNGIAIGFLYQTSAPGVAWIDGFVTDPESTKEARAIALRELTETLYEFARRIHIRVVWSSTSAPTLIELGQACGAKIYQRDHVILARVFEPE